jgi:hypothetical protein
MGFFQNPIFRVEHACSTLNMEKSHVNMQHLFLMDLLTSFLIWPLLRCGGKAACAAASARMMRQLGEALACEGQGARRRVEPSHRVTSPSFNAA